MCIGLETPGGNRWPVRSICGLNSSVVYVRISRDREGAQVAVDRAVAWLTETQHEDGSWDEPYYTGTGFPGDFYLNYHLYRQVFPVMALGRIVERDA